MISTPRILEKAREKTVDALQLFCLWTVLGSYFLVKNSLSREQSEKVLQQS